MAQYSEKKPLADVTSSLLEHDSLTALLNVLLTSSTTPLLLHTHGAYRLASSGQYEDCPSTAYDRPDCAHGARYCVSDSSVMYAFTMFVVGVEKVIVALGSQYCSSTLLALQTSAVAEEPQLSVTSDSMPVETSARTPVLEQMQDCRPVSSSPQRVVRV